jgi:hypothetical protein
MAPVTPAAQAAATPTRPPSKPLTCPPPKPLTCLPSLLPLPIPESPSSSTTDAISSTDDTGTRRAAASAAPARAAATQGATVRRTTTRMAPAAVAGRSRSLVVYLNGNDLYNEDGVYVASLAVTQNTSARHAPSSPHGILMHDVLLKPSATPRQQEPSSMHAKQSGCCALLR